MGILRRKKDSMRWLIIVTIVTIALLLMLIFYDGRK
jgi:hypothetical protein